MRKHLRRLAFWYLDVPAELQYWLNQDRIYDAGFAVRAIRLWVNVRQSEALLARVRARTS